MPRSAQDSGVLRWGTTSSWWVDPKGRLWSGGLVGLGCSAGGVLGGGSLVGFRKHFPNICGV